MHATDWIGRSRRRFVIAGVVLLFALTELGVRVAGLVDMPTYVLDSHFGYAPRPSQAGRFLTQNSWVFNDRGMGVAADWNPLQDRTDVVLIGNSIVLGGNTYDQKDKIAPQMQSRLKASCAIWPVAAGGWTTVNEYRFMERHPDIVSGVDFFVWEYMAHQIGGVNPTVRETSHPTHLPAWATGYVIHKAMDQRFPATPRFELPRADEAAQNYDQFDAMLGKLVKASGRLPAGVIFLYPDFEQLAAARRGVDWLPDRQRMEKLAAKNGIVLIDIAASPLWTAEMYKDGIHPTKDGNAVLASILADTVRKYAPPC